MPFITGEQGSAPVMYNATGLCQTQHQCWVCGSNADLTVTRHLFIYIDGVLFAIMKRAYPTLISVKLLKHLIKGFEPYSE